MIPANIRFTFYHKAKDLKLENKFAAIPLTVPLSKSMEQAFGKIIQVTKALRDSFPMIYGVYAVSFWSALLMPRCMVSNTIHTVSNKFTMGFSNTPGPIKPFFYKNPKTGEIVKNIHSQSYLMVAGNLGMVLCSIS